MDQRRRLAWAFTAAGLVCLVLAGLAQAALFLRGLP